MLYYIGTRAQQRLKIKFFNRGICICVHLTQTRYAQKACAEMRGKRHENNRCNCRPWKPRKSNLCADCQTISGFNGDYSAGRYQSCLCRGSCKRVQRTEGALLYECGRAFGTAEAGRCDFYLHSGSGSCPGSAGGAGKRLSYPDGKTDFSQCRGLQ